MRIRWLAALALLAALAASTPARAESGLPPVDRYFSASELRRSHPAARQDRVYHGVQHSLDIRRFEYDMARGRGVPATQARFLSEVALLHDWDPRRVPGTPARVGATLDALDADFEGRESLVPGKRGSILRTRFGWNARDLEIAKALIHRTTFPFDADAAKGYEQRLEALAPSDRQFVLQEGALLSEYADKGSTYAMRSVKRVKKATRGLASEINRMAGRRVTSAAKLDPGAFITSLGARSHFATDHAIARRLGLRVSYPTRATVLARMPPSYRVHFGATMRANGAGPRPEVNRRAGGRPPRDARPPRMRGESRRATRAARR